MKDNDTCPCAALTNALMVRARIFTSVQEALPDLSGNLPAKSPAPCLPECGRLQVR